MHSIKGHLIILGTAALLIALLMLTGCTDRRVLSDASGHGIPTLFEDTTPPR